MSDMIMSSHEREAMAKMQVMERRLVDREAIVASLPVRDEAVDVGGDGKFRSVKKVIKPSTERFVLPGERVTVRYTGWVVPTAVVEEAVRRKFEPPFDTSPGFSFTLGAMDVISGWEMGVGTMRIGERAYLVLAPEHAYGSAGAGSTIPPNATLLFDIEVLAVHDVKPDVVALPQLIGGLVALLLVVYYCFFYDAQQPQNIVPEL